GQRFAAPALAPDGKSFAASCFDGTLVLADAATGKKLRTFEGEPRSVDALVFTPNARRLIGTDRRDERIRVWDTAAGKELSPLATLPNAKGALCMALSPDGKFLATGGMDRTLRLCDVAAGKEVGQLLGQEG